MFTSIWEDIKQQFNNGNTLMRIILVNVAVFVVVTLMHLILMPVKEGFTYDNFLHFFIISSAVSYTHLTLPTILLV